MTSDPATLWMVAGVYVLAGFIKGIIGIGLPTTALALLTFIVTPLQAIAINILPMLVSISISFCKPIAIASWYRIIGDLPS